MSKQETSPGSGIWEVTYQLPGGKPQPKTVYDPAKYPSMPLFAEAAAQKGLMDYQMNGVQGARLVDVGGFRFEVVVNPSKSGPPNVPTVYPKGIVK